MAQKSLRTTVLVFSALQPLVSDLRNICGQDHSKKFTILENSVDAMQEQIRKCTIKEATTSKLKQ